MKQSRMGEKLATIGVHDWHIPYSRWLWCLSEYMSYKCMTVPYPTIASIFHAQKTKTNICNTPTIAPNTIINEHIKSSTFQGIIHGSAPILHGATNERYICTCYIVLVIPTSLIHWIMKLVDKNRSPPYFI